MQKHNYLHWQNIAFITFSLFRTKLNSLASSTDMKEYKNLLEICVTNYIYGTFLNTLFFTFFMFVDRPKLFDNDKQLNDIDRLHIELFNQKSEEYLYFHNSPSSPKNKLR